MNWKSLSEGDQLSFLSGASFSSGDNCQKRQVQAHKLTAHKVATVCVLLAAIFLLYSHPKKACDRAPISSAQCVQCSTKWAGRIYTHNREIRIVCFFHHIYSKIIRQISRYKYFQFFIHFWTKKKKKNVLPLRTCQKLPTRILLVQYAYRVQLYYDYEQVISTGVTGVPKTSTAGQIWSYLKPILYHVQVCEIFWLWLIPSTKNTVLRKTECKVCTDTGTCTTPHTSNASTTFILQNK